MYDIFLRSIILCGIGFGGFFLNSSDTPIFAFIFEIVYYVGKMDLKSLLNFKKEKFSLPKA